MFCISYVQLEKAIVMSFEQSVLVFHYFMNNYKAE